MARNLYRFYLYAICIALLIFAIVAVGRLLSTVLQLTPLHDTGGQIPGSVQIVQAIVFTVVSLIIVGVLGSLHYWLIRRDIRNDPLAINSGIRAFFLHIPAGIAIVLVVPIIGFGVLTALGDGSQYGIVNSLATALPVLGFALLLELELRRTGNVAEAGTALALQRVRVYGVQLLLLILLAFSFPFTFRTIENIIIFGSQNGCTGEGCVAYNPVYLVLNILWFMGWWLGYGLVSARDRAPRLRLVLHGLSFAYGIILLLEAVYALAELVLAPAFKQDISVHIILSSNFLSQLISGALIVGVYYFLLSRAIRQGLLAKSLVSLTELAIAGVLAGFAFWSGCGYIIYNALQQTTNPAAADSWKASIALVITGLAYIPLDFYLRRRTRSDGHTIGPRRGQVFALLGGGIVAGAVGGATALYAVMTAAFGSPIENWPQVAHQGLAAFLIGIIVVGLYVSNVWREHLITRAVKEPESTVPTQVAEPAESLVQTEAATSTEAANEKTIDSIIDTLLQGTITRDDAVEQIRALQTEPRPV